MKLRSVTSDQMNRNRCDQTQAWSHLQALAARPFDLRAAFAEDPKRAAAFGIQAPHVFADLSKQRCSPQTDEALLQLARECDVEQHRDAMFAGETINATEQRSVMHWLLRATSSDGLGPVRTADGPRVAPDLMACFKDVDRVRVAMLDYAEQVRADAGITDVVNIGIGGSDLGPQMAVAALDGFVGHGKRFHFVSNVDGHELAGVLRGLKADSTLFLVASKTFTTIETMTNAASAKAWFLAQGGTDVARHFAALTTNVEAARSFGISTTFGFWDWVGGRYSMWSAIGLPIAIAVGRRHFLDLLLGAAEMDDHFRVAPLEQNLPVRLALIDVWNRNFLGFSSRCIAPYHAHLRRLPAYLQQLEMESNGKRVDMSGAALTFGTSPVLWGEPGTNGQHAFFQMLHQGTDVVPVEFVVVKKPSHALGAHHSLLLANAIAQAQALMSGKSDSGGHKHFTGNRPSSFLVLDELTPRSFGALIALQEHRVFVSGSLWGINSFDQWGVELGKALAKDIEARWAGGSLSGLDASTAALVQRLR